MSVWSPLGQFEGSRKFASSQVGLVKALYPEEASTELGVLGVLRSPQPGVNWVGDVFECSRVALGSPARILSRPKLAKRAPSANTASRASARVLRTRQPWERASLEADEDTVNELLE